MGKINWNVSIEEAERKAVLQNKLLFLFFHRKNCGGCNKTMDETLTNPEVIEVIENNCIPVILEETEDQKLSLKYKIEWMPTFIVADENGVEMEHWVGYLPAKDFISQLYSLGRTRPVSRRKVPRC